MATFTRRNRCGGRRSVRAPWRPHCRRLDLIDLSMPFTRFCQKSNECQAVTLLRRDVNDLPSMIGKGSRALVAARRFDGFPRLGDRLTTVQSASGHNLLATETQSIGHRDTETPSNCGENCGITAGFTAESAEAAEKQRQSFLIVKQRDYPFCVVKNKKR